MSRYNRTCILCGKQFKFCNDCRDYEHIEPWHNIYCSENCKKIFNTAVNYKQNIITKDQAKEILSACDLSNRANFKSDVLAAVNEIMGFKDEPKTEETKPEQKFEQPKAEEQKSAEKENKDSKESQNLKDSQDTKKSNEEVPFHRRKMSKR